MVYLRDKKKALWQKTTAQETIDYFRKKNIPTASGPACTAMVEPIG